MSGSVAIVGPGRMGLALAGALDGSAAVDGLVLYGRHPEPPDHPLFAARAAEYVFGLAPLRRDCRALFLAVPDRGLSEVARLAAAQGRAPEGCAAFHLSGALPTDLLAPLHDAGFAVGAYRPLVRVSRVPAAAERLRGARVAVTAGREAMRVAAEMAAAMRSVVLPVPAAGRPLVDAAVSLTESYLPLLLDSAARVLARAGVEPDDALPALAPLVGSVLEEVAVAGLPATLAQGPLGGADLERVALHLRALGDDERRLYAMVGWSAASVAGAHLEPALREEILERFDQEIGG